MSPETTIQPSHNRQQAAAVIKTPDPKVMTKAERRRFRAEYKVRILAEADACTPHGEIWRPITPGRLYPLAPGQMGASKRPAGALQALAPQKRGPKPDPQAAEIARSRHGKERLSHNVCSNVCSGPRRLSRSKKTLSAARPADEQTTSSYDSNGRRTGGLAGHRRRLCCAGDTSQHLLAGSSRRQVSDRVNLRLEPRMIPELAVQIGQRIDDHLVVDQRHRQGLRRRKMGRLHISQKTHDYSSHRTARRSRPAPPNG